MVIDTKEKLKQLHIKMIEEIQDYAIVLLDIDGTILTWNKGVENIQGYKEDEIVGKNFRLFYLDRDREENIPEKLLGLAIKEGRARHIGRRLRKNGTVFWANVLITALHDEEGHILGFTKLARELRENEME